jgi:L-amino acid N-acyltransferase YncA
MGFRYIGTFSDIGFKFGEFQHLGWWQRTLSPERPVRDPISFRSLAS